MQKYVYNIIHSAEKKDIHSRKLFEQTTSITVDEVKDVFKAEIKAMNEVQIHKPKLNKPFKTQSEQFAIYVKKDEKNLCFLAISRTKNLEATDSPLIYSSSFKT